MELRLSRRRGGSHLQEPLRRGDHRQSERPDALEYVGGGRAHRAAVRDQDHAMPLPRTYDGHGDPRVDAAFNSYLPDEVVFTRGGPGHRISDGAKVCNFKWDFIG